MNGLHWRHIRLGPGAHQLAVSRTMLAAVDEPPQWLLAWLPGTPMATAGTHQLASDAGTYMETVKLASEDQRPVETCSKPLGHLVVAAAEDCIGPLTRDTRPLPLQGPLTITLASRAPCGHGFDTDVGAPCCTCLRERCPRRLRAQGTQHLLLAPPLRCHHKSNRLAGASAAVLMPADVKCPRHWRQTTCDWLVCQAAVRWYNFACAGGIHWRFGTAWEPNTTGQS